MAIIEAAFVTPVFFTLVLGIIELGLAMNSELALSHATRAGTRVASASGNDKFADYGIIKSLSREISALPKGQIKQIVVYRASKFGEAPSTGCQGGTGANPGTSTTAPACNVYTVADFTRPKAEWGCLATSPDRFWCPTKRKVTTINGGSEYVGVWVKVEHRWVSWLFGKTVTLTDQSVIRLEPRTQS